MTSKTSQLDNLFEAQKAAFVRNIMPSAQERIDNLNSLEQAIIKHKDKLISAVNSDFGCRCPDETLLAEIIPTVEAVRYIKKRVKKWMKPSYRTTGMLFQPAKSMLIYQPLGVVGVITPWNYPIYLAMGPLAGALGAGNRVMIRMSKNTPHTALALQEMVESAFKKDHVLVMTADECSGSSFAQKNWDHLVFTGSTSVGRQIMRAASENLTPVTLELGGKSPAIISQDFPMKDAAERIAFGKAFNMGQTCVAPDHVLCPATRIDEFATLFKSAVEKMYPTMKNNPQYTSIINQDEYSRLQDILDDARAKGAQIIPINPADEPFDSANNTWSSQRKMAVTLIVNVNNQMRVMQEEIFGPILPVIPYDRFEDAIEFVNQRPRPLALYYFDYNRGRVNYLLTHTHSGGALINDTLVHVAQDDMPFGGVGESGMGQYHGHEGFLTFSKAKGVLLKPRVNSGKFIYPPYGGKLHSLLYKLLLKS